MKDLIKRIYGDSLVDTLTNRINKLIEEYSVSQDPLNLSNKDVVLITYGDQIQQEDENPLRTLNDFLDRYVSDVVSTVHILPFYPYSSDDGFSVITLNLEIFKDRNFCDFADFGLEKANIGH